MSCRADAFFSFADATDFERRDDPIVRFGPYQVDRTLGVREGEGARQREVAHLIKLVEHLVNAWKIVPDPGTNM